MSIEEYRRYAEIHVTARREIEIYDLLHSTAAVYQATEKHILCSIYLPRTRVI